MKKYTFTTPRHIAAMIAIVCWITLSAFYFLHEEPVLNEVTNQNIAGLHEVSNEAKKVRTIQEQVLKIYPEMLATTVKVILGNSFASAVVVSEDGYILTAAHVIDAVGGKTATVRLHDGSIYTATCLGKDNMADYGLMKIDPTKKLAFAQMGSSGDLAKDEACIMFGNPAASDRERAAIGRIGFYEGITEKAYLKTSCIMMPGDSGGPLFDLEGKVVGICSFIRNGITENYYPSIDQVKKNWSRLVANERFNLGKNNNNRTFTEAPTKDKPYVLQGGKKTLTKVLSKHIGNTTKSVVRIESTLENETVTTFGTLVSTDGYIVAKSSLIGSLDIICTTENETIKAEIIGRDEDNDIVVLRIKSTKKLRPILLNLANDTPGQLVGTFVADDSSMRMSGILGLASRAIFKKEYGFLGISFDREKDLVIERISKGMAAENAGLQTGDQIMAMNAIKFQNYEAFSLELKKTRPLQKVEISILRDGALKNIQVILGKRSNSRRRHLAYNTKTNKRNDGFPLAFTHDMPLEVSQSGTPVINLKGEVIGINIARRNRTCSLAIPTHKIKEIVNAIITVP